VTTREKIQALIDEVRTMDPREADPSSRNLIEAAQILQGLGVDPLAMLLPTTDAEADQQVDSLIALLYQVRGDDLPPFDLERHMIEATATDDAN
jgi:hypothetical protein